MKTVSCGLSARERWKTEAGETRRPAGHLRNARRRAMSYTFEAEFDQAIDPSPLVSVIVPTFNRAALLRVAIASVLCQSAANLEVVVIDDGSKDSTPAVVMELAEKDKRVRYFRQKNR